MNSFIWGLNNAPRMCQYKILYDQMDLDSFKAFDYVLQANKASWGKSEI